jgi:hypothetical protein
MLIDSFPFSPCFLLHSKDYLFCLFLGLAHPLLTIAY